MANGINNSDAFLKAPRNYELSEDFHSGAPDEWTTDGTATADDSRGGVLSLATAATNNDPASVVLDSKVGVLADSKPLHFLALIQYTEANTDDANLFVGFTSQAAATAMQDNGGGPPASYSGIGFHKLDGGTNWIVEFSVGGTQKTVELNAEGSLRNQAEVAGGAAYVELSISAIPKAGSKCDVSFMIDGVVVQRFLDQDYTSIAAMHPIALIKAGDSNAETLKVDLIQVAAVR